MSEQYAREILRRNVAQICQTIGWNGINSTPLDILVHVLEKYILTLGTQANRYAEQFNRTEPNLNDLALVFRDLHIQLPELAEYTRCVPPVPPPLCAEKFPVPKESVLNFLKPGSHEVVTRPMHVHEHLPPMYPEKEQDTPAVAGTVEIQQNGVDNEENSATSISPNTSAAESSDKPKDPFKRPIDPISMPSKRPRLRLDEEERTREISSVMMTMSGFLSPAREGKLPEARPPIIISEKHEKHKSISHHSAIKVPTLEKGDKKSKKNKVLNGKIMKSKRKDKSHKSDSSKHKDSKSNKHPPGYPMKAKDVHHTHNHLPMPAPKSTISPKAAMGPPPVPLLVPEVIRPIVKQEPVDAKPSPIPSPVSSPSNFPKNLSVAEEAIPVPRKIPISKSPLAPNPFAMNKNPTPSLVVANTEIKKEIVEEEEKLASQPDRSKINIFKRISNKSKEDKSASEIVAEKSAAAHSSKSQENVHGSSTQSVNENVRVKSEDSHVNNNNSNAVDLSKEMDLRAHEVIDVDDDSLDRNPQVVANPTNINHPSISSNLPLSYSKEVASATPKIKKEKKHKDKKDKAAKLEAKLLKKQQQQLALEMAQAEKQMKIAGAKPTKSSRPKNESKIPPMHPGFPFFPVMPSGRNMMPGPGLLPNPGLIPGNDFLAGLANNPALRGLPPSNLLSNPFAMNASGPGLIPSGTGFMPGTMASGIGSPLMHMGNFPHTSRSPSVKIPPLLRRPSLEVIPVDNDDDRGFHKSMGRDKDRQDKHKPMTIPNILQKHKSKYKDNKMNTYKMPPVQPDITIELNPPKIETIRQEPVKEPLVVPPRSPTPEPTPLPPPPQPEPSPAPTKLPQETPVEKVAENAEKKKDKSHKKIKKDKEGKIKKKKDKKDKSKDKEKTEKKKLKEEKHELKEKIKKEKKEKKKEKLLEKADGLVPKLTLKLGSSNSNSPMPPSSPDVFKLNIKPVVKKDEEEEVPAKEESASREHSRSPELAQISALVTRPPKQKHSKQNHVGEAEAQSPPPVSGSPPRKNRPPSSYSKYKRILFKPLSKKCHFVDETGSVFEEEQNAPTAAAAPVPASEQAKPIDKVIGPLPTPYYVDEQGNKIWVCPACGRPDNGSPMIGCDGCDGWYHWVCVGITEEPGATEDWFCKSCLAKRTAMELAGVTTSGKKRGRKPKAEKIRDCH